MANSAQFDLDGILERTQRALIGDRDDLTLTMFDNPKRIELTKRVKGAELPDMARFEDSWVIVAKISPNKIEIERALKPDVRDIALLREVLLIVQHKIAVPTPEHLVNPVPKTDAITDTVLDLPTIQVILWNNWEISARLVDEGKYHFLDVFYGETRVCRISQYGRVHMLRAADSSTRDIMGSVWEAIGLSDPVDEGNADA